MSYVDFVLILTRGNFPSDADQDSPDSGLSPLLVIVFCIKGLVISFIIPSHKTHSGIGQ